MSAQDARVVEAIREGVKLGTSVASAPLVKLFGVPATFAWDLVKGDVEAAIEKAIRAALDACGVATGHVQITGGPEAKVGFEVLPTEEGKSS